MCKRIMCVLINLSLSFMLLGSIFSSSAGIKLERHEGVAGDVQQSTALGQGYER